MQKRKKKVNDDQRSGDKLSGKQFQVDVIWFCFLQSFVVSVFSQNKFDMMTKANLRSNDRRAQIGIRFCVTQSAAAEFSNLLTCVWPHLFHFFFITF